MSQKGGNTVGGAAKSKRKKPVAKRPAAGMPRDMSPLAEAVYKILLLHYHTAFLSPEDLLERLMRHGWSECFIEDVWYALDSELAGVLRTQQGQGVTYMLRTARVK